MELDPKTVSSVWWGGTIKGALKGLVVGLAVGACSALMLEFVLIPLFPLIGLPSIEAAFAGFLTLTPGAAGASFSMVPLAIFSGISGMLGNALNSGATAVNAYKQDVEHRMNDARITAIESREQLREPTLAPSRAVQKILAQGPRNRDSYEAAEAEREASTPAGPTIH